MKYILIVFAILFYISPAFAQYVTDSINVHRKEYAASKKDDEARFKLYMDLSIDYRRNNSDSALFYARKGMKIATQLNNKLYQLQALGCIEFTLRETGDLAEALNIQLQALDKARQLKSLPFEAVELNSIGNSYLELGDPKNGLEYYRNARAIMQSLSNKNNVQYNSLPHYKYWVNNENSNMGNTFEQMGLLDSALIYETKLYHNKDFPPDLMPELLSRLATLKVRLGNNTEAMKLYKKGVALSFQQQTTNDRAAIYYQMALLLNKWRQPDSAIFYAKRSYRAAQSISLRKVMLSASVLLAKLYDQENLIDSAFYYQRIEIAYNDTLFGVQKFMHIELILSNEQRRQQAIIQEQETQRYQYEIIGAAGAVLFILLILLLVWRNNWLQKRKNKLLNLQKEQITLQRDEMKLTLENLHKTQTQLIQSEKMASLGELTAGIAHEIQNPLNFVNNFSEVNREMIDELGIELKAGNIDEALAIVDDIRKNEEKINHHGKRADGIVKGMLQHSRASSTTKEPTDINKLADEYLRLAYHGLRAKDKSFNAELVTHFGENLPMVQAVPQDIGRVLLNLFTNAFYATQQKQKTAGPDYKPTVEVSTLAEKDFIVIKVKDNGNGIPDTIKEKIMQPFFTTKPTGEGTGLGLSISYDIVVKGHRGKIDVLSKENEFTEFIISIPV